MENECILCPRNCSVDRVKGKTGYCGQTDKIYVARAALHMWEEPCISGENGSGTVFFSHCNMKFSFDWKIICNNKVINDGVAVAFFYTDTEIVTINGLDVIVIRSKIKNTYFSIKDGKAYIKVSKYCSKSKIEEPLYTTFKSGIIS